MILVALNNAGGDKYLERQAHANPVAFMGLLGKILPHQMKLEADMKGDQPITISVSWLDGSNRLSYADREPVQALVQDVTPKKLPTDGSDLW
jgi:hypothetical protein